ncbi:hypothetical protein [Fodinicola feengrottensis]|uniref:hypothetical protein n=1 Tax=Fodinicola feengrottensis TaxID=435914 RepID=UPI0013D2A0D8|nr:hypothetical protein [Fodinicola feengrottensis]
MPVDPVSPYSRPADLPPYQGILVVDAEKFTAARSRDHQPLSTEIARVVAAEAARRSGLAAAWATPRFFNSTGDGVAIGVPTELLPRLVHPYLRYLQEILAERNDNARRQDPLLRLRVSLNVGPLPGNGDNPFFDGNGKPRNDAHRLLDSKVAKMMLAASSDTVTHVVAILSDRVYEDVVEGGYAGLHPDHFVDVSAVVPGKSFTQHAWLHIPAPSANRCVVAFFRPRPKNLPRPHQGRRERTTTSRSRPTMAHKRRERSTAA